LKGKVEEVADILAPVGRILRDRGYSAELIADEQDETVTLKLVVMVHKKWPT